MRMPPLIVYRLNSSTMNGMYSCRMALSRTVRTKPPLHAPRWSAHQMVRRPMAFDRRVVKKRVVSQRQERQPAGDRKLLRFDSHQWCAGRDQR